MFRDIYIFQNVRGLVHFVRCNWGLVRYTGATNGIQLPYQVCVQDIYNQNIMPKGS